MSRNYVSEIFPIKLIILLILKSFKAAEDKWQDRVSWTASLAFQLLLFYQILMMVLTDDIGHYLSPQIPSH